tara:strand:+ start:163 stop:1053 length:891 start_codon:yes stop_codon:yes gene_type:complete
MNDRLRQELIAADGPLAGESILAIAPVAGGCIHRAWRLDLAGGRTLFAKSGTPDAMALFEVEADALEALHGYADVNVLAVPRPLAVRRLAHGAVLMMPWMALEGTDQSALGRGLALLHKEAECRSPGRFGWHRDGFIGAGPQPGGWREGWGDCFVELRLRPQLELAVDLDVDPALLKQLLAHLSHLLNNHSPEPCLVHGDLWGGNAGCLNDGRGALFDPASWWADREVDLAMTKLFGGFSRDFYDSYESVLPNRNGAEKRTNIYNLYHLLNHANLFGGSYVKQSRASLQRLAQQLL